MDSFGDWLIPFGTSDTDMIFPSFPAKLLLIVQMEYEP